MRQVLMAILLLFSAISFGQKSDKWLLSFQLQPELTYHKNQYSFRWEEKFTKQTFNIGLSSSIQYNLADRMFLEGGLAFISRRLVAQAFVDQSLLPPPYYDSTQILYVTKSIALRTLQLPLSAGLIIVRAAKARVFVKCSYMPNFLLNVKYEANNYPGFHKSYWQGCSLNAGVGMDHHLSNKIILTGSLMFTLVNTVVKDSYLFSQDERPIALPHTYVQVSSGLKIPLHQL